MLHVEVHNVPPQICLPVILKLSLKILEGQDHLGMPSIKIPSVEAFLCLAASLFYNSNFNNIKILPFRRESELHFDWSNIFRGRNL